MDHGQCNGSHWPFMKCTQLLLQVLFEVSCCKLRLLRSVCTKAAWNIWRWNSCSHVHRKQRTKWNKTHSSKHDVLLVIFALCVICYICFIKQYLWQLSWHLHLYLCLFVSVNDAKGKRKVLGSNQKLKFNPTELVLYCKDLRIIRFCFDEAGPEGARKVSESQFDCKQAPW